MARSSQPARKRAAGKKTPAKKIPAKKTRGVGGVRLLPRSELGRLIYELQGPEDSPDYVSDQTIADRAYRAGIEFSKQRVSALRNAYPLPTIVPSNMRALAIGLEQPLARIVRAALLSTTSEDVPGLADAVTGPDLDWSPERAIAADPELRRVRGTLLTIIAAARHGESLDSGTVTALPRAARKPPPSTATRRMPPNGGERQ